MIGPASLGDLLANEPIVLVRWWSGEDKVPMACSGTAVRDEAALLHMQLDTSGLYYWDLALVASLNALQTRTPFQVPLP